jgi:hypothetical protein
MRAGSSRDDVPMGMATRLLLAAIVATTPVHTQLDTPQPQQQQQQQHSSKERQIHRITPPRQREQLPRQLQPQAPSTAGDPPPPKLQRLHTSPDFARWDAESRAGVVEYTAARSQWLRQHRTPVQVLAFLNASEADHEIDLAALDEVAREEAGRVLVAFVPSERQEHAPVLERFGVRSDELPASVLVLQPDDSLGHAMRVYKMQRADVQAEEDDGAELLQWESPVGRAGGEGGAAVREAGSSSTVVVLPADGTQAPQPLPPSPLPPACDSNNEACGAKARHLTAEALRGLIAGARTGILRRFFRSQPVLETHTEDTANTGIATVVGGSFYRLVLGQARDVLLVAHEPGCPICHRLLGVLPDVAAQARQSGSPLLIGTVDGSRNDIDDPVFEASPHYPIVALFVWDAAKKTHRTVALPWTQDRARSPEPHLLGFLRNHATEWNDAM